MDNVLEKKISGRGSSAFVAENLLSLVGCCPCSLPPFPPGRLNIACTMGGLHVREQSSDKRGGQGGKQK